MTRATVGLCAVLAAQATMPAPGAAQHLAPQFASAGTLSPVASLPWSPPASRDDFRWVGAVIGAASFGLAAGLEARAACGNSEHGPRDCTGVTIGVGFLSAAAGGALGYFIGRAIPRH